MTNVEMRTTIARSLGGMRNALDALERYYNDPKPDADLPYRWFPYPSKFKSPEGHERRFVYDVPSSDLQRKYVDRLRKKLVFFATIKGESEEKDKPICVKFVRHYSREAHEFCANRKFAPELLGIEYLVGDWIMVVMDRIGRNFILLSSIENKEEYVHLYDIIGEKLKQLHQGGLVHGDVRDANIMVSQIPADKTFFLLDFDWGGKIDEHVRYPMNVFHSKDLWRPKNAVDGKPILAEHDIQMLAHMFGMPI